MSSLTVKFTRDDIAHLLWVEATRRLGIENSEMDTTTEFGTGGEVTVTLSNIRSRGGSVPDPVGVPRAASGRGFSL